MDGAFTQGSSSSRPGRGPSCPMHGRVSAARVLTSDTLFEQETLPARIAVVGLGVVGCEIAQALSRLGIEITAFVAGQRLAGLQDPLVSEQAHALLSAEYTIHLGARAALEPESDRIRVSAGDRSVLVDGVLAALGRRPNVDDLGLENLGVQLDESGMPPFNVQSLQIEDLPIYFAGDVNGKWPVLHEASDDGYISGYNAPREDAECFPATHAARDRLYRPERRCGGSALRNARCAEHRNRRDRFFATGPGSRGGGEPRPAACIRKQGRRPPARRRDVRAARRTSRAFAGARRNAAPDGASVAQSALLSSRVSRRACAPRCAIARINSILRRSPIWRIASRSALRRWIDRTGRTWTDAANVRTQRLLLRRHYDSSRQQSSRHGRPAGTRFASNRAPVGVAHSNGGCMRRRLTLLSSIGASIALAIGGCGEKKPAAQAEQAAAAPEIARYDAKAFFTTTSFGLASGYAWSPDNKELLVHSDETGIFNAYALPRKRRGQASADLLHRRFDVRSVVVSGRRARALPGRQGRQ